MTDHTVDGHDMSGTPNELELGQMWAGHAIGDDPVRRDLAEWSRSLRSELAFPIAPSHAEQIAANAAQVVKTARLTAQRPPTRTGARTPKPRSRVVFSAIVSSLALKVGTAAAAVAVAAGGVASTEILPDQIDRPLESVFALVSLDLSPTDPTPAGVTVSGERKQWHRVSVTFDGPDSSETAAVNPFLDYRLNVTFNQGGQTLTVPGFFDGDG